MMRFLRMTIIVLIFALIQSCSNLKQSQNPSQNINDQVSLPVNPPERIPMFIDKAFLPLRRGPDGKIVPSYQWRECKKKFIWCHEWESKKVLFLDLEWFLANGWGLSKRPSIK